MNNKSVFKKFYNKLAREGALKSLMISATAALFAAGLAAFVAWYFGFNAMWIVIGAVAGITVVLTPILYFAKFRPNTKSISKRLDALGLEERILTMSELEHDDSFIAMKQREDATRALNSVEPKALKYAVSWVTIFVLSLSLVFAGTGTTVSALGAKGVIPDGGKVVEDLKPTREEFYTLKYVAIDYKAFAMFGAFSETDGGIFEGNDEQLVAKGEDGEPVLALADPDYNFLGWLDGTSDPYRIDPALLVTNDNFDTDNKIIEEDGSVTVFDDARGWLINKDGSGNVTITVYALFSPIEGGDPSQSEDGDPSDGDSEEDAPSEGQPSDSDSKDDKSEQDPDKDQNPSDKDSDPSKPDKDGNKVIDGDQNYSDRIQEYIEWYEELKASGADIPPELQEIIDNYYDSLK